MRSKWIVGLLTLSLGVLATQVFAGEDDIRSAFAALQKAIKVRDPEKIWGLIDTETQADADRAAKAVKKAFGKIDDTKKADFEKQYGLSAKELADMNGKLFIKSNKFHGKYYEIPDSKITSVIVKGNSARVNYVEEDGDKVKLNLVKQKGQWRFTIPMPKAVN